MYLLCIKNMLKSLYNYIYYVTEDIKRKLNLAFSISIWKLGNVDPPRTTLGRGEYVVGDTERRFFARMDVL